MTTSPTPEQIQAHRENERVVDILRNAIERGDMQALRDKDGHPAWHLWRGPTAGTSLLQMATSFPVDPEEFVALAVRQGLSMTELDGKGRSIMFYVFNSPADKRMLWIQALHSAGLAMNHADSIGQTALAMAVIKGDESILDWLIEIGTEPSEEDHRRVRLGNHRITIARFWERFGQQLTADEMAQDLLKACQEGRWQYATLLLDNDADPFLRDENGCTTLMLAFSRTRAPVALAQRLVTLGVDPNCSVTLPNGKTVTAMGLLEENNRQGNSRSQKRVEEARLAIARGREQRLTHQLEDQQVALPSTRIRM